MLNVYGAHEGWRRSCVEDDKTKYKQPNAQSQSEKSSCLFRRSWWNTEHHSICHHEDSLSRVQLLNGGWERGRDGKIAEMKKKKTQKFKVERESKNETRQTKWSNTLETWSSSLFWPVGIRLWQTSSSLLSTDTQTHTPCFPGGPDLSQLGSVNFSDSVGGGEKLEKDKHTHTHTHRLGSIYLRIRFRPLFNCASVSGSVSTAHSHQAGAFTAVTPRHQHWRQPDHHSQTQSLAVFYSRAICLQLKRELNRWPCTYQTPSV